MKLKILSLIMILTVLMIPMSVTYATGPIPQGVTHLYIKGHTQHHGIVLHKFRCAHGQNITIRRDSSLVLFPKVMNNGTIKRREDINCTLYDSNNTILYNETYFSGVCLIGVGIHIGPLPVGIYRLRLDYYGNEKKGLLPCYEDVLLIVSNPIY